DQIKALTGGRGADYVFEAIGIPQVQEQSLQVVRPGGTVVFEGISPMGSETNLPGAIITRKEISIKGSYYGSGNTAREFPKYADLYLRGMLAIDQLVTRTYSLDQINEAFADMIAGNTARGVIVFPD
ncbi:MAG: zinc-binding dehydrogenase, partial [Anaerolineae bacterium]|nr:zinc-binding dehydrogenase [Anaerolineae bacterium]